MIFICNNSFQTSGYWLMQTMSLFRKMIKNNNNNENDNNNNDIGNVINNNDKFKNIQSTI